jgi:Signal transduction histidine kinase
MERIYTMALNFSHEVKTPLAIISTNLSLLEINPDKAYIERISRALKQLNNLLNKVVFIAKADEYSMLNKQTFMLEDVVMKALKELEPIIEEKGLKIELNIEPIEVTSSWELYEAIVSNLLENAVKYTNEGYIKIAVVSDNKNIIIKVEDTGVGIPKEKLSTITKEFERANIDKPGFGLGLFIVSKSVGILKGKLHIESEEKQRHHYNSLYTVLGKFFLVYVKGCNKCCKYYGPKTYPKSLLNNPPNTDKDSSI